MHACRHSSNDEGVEWSHLAGYDEVKEQVQLCCASLAVQFALVMLRPSHSPALPHGCSAKRVRLCATEHGWYCESTHDRQTGVALYGSVQVEETVMLQLQHAEMFKKVPCGHAHGGNTCSAARLPIRFARLRHRSFKALEWTQTPQIGPKPCCLRALRVSDRPVPASTESMCVSAMRLSGVPQAGCGKTTMARMIATRVKIPMVYVPLEAVMSKWSPATSASYRFCLGR